MTTRPDPENHKPHLYAALADFAKFHDVDDLAAPIVYMDSVDEFMERWHSAYIRRAWFLDALTETHKRALVEFDEACRAVCDKYKTFKPIMKFFGSRDGQALAAKATEVLAMLGAPQPGRADTPSTAETD